MQEYSEGVSRKALEVTKQAHAETDPQAKAQLQQKAKELRDESAKSADSITKFSNDIGRGVRVTEAIRDVAPWLLGGLEAKSNLEIAKKTGGFKEVSEFTKKNAKTTEPDISLKQTPIKTQAEKATDLQSLKEKISPKPTVKEARLATEQGRLVKGKEPTLLKSVQTVDRLIPEHAKMSEPELYTAIKEKIGETAEALKPEMKKVAIKEETVQRISDEWKKAKKQQAENAYTPSDVNLKKLQTDFETRLKKSKSGTMNDLWETRQAYDDSVPDNVKRASDLSSESLQAKKDIWLQNRRILSDAINDVENGLGETSRKPFSDMRDMYDAKNGILSKAKIETKVKPSKIKGVLKHPAVKAAGEAIGIGTGLNLIR